MTIQTHVRYNDRGIKKPTSGKTLARWMTRQSHSKYVCKTHKWIFRKDKYNIKNHLWQVCYRNSNIKERTKLNRVPNQQVKSIHINIHHRLFFVLKFEPWQLNIGGYIWRNKILGLDQSATAAIITVMNADGEHVFGNLIINKCRVRKEAEEAYYFLIRKSEFVNK